jgi:DNA-binding transcriptional MocR family regulator
MEQIQDGGFIQMYRNYIPALRILNKQSAVAANMFLYLAEQMDAGNAVACSSRILEEALGVGRATVFRAISVLKKSGFVVIYKMGTTNVFTLSSDIVWCATPSGREYAVLKGSIMIAKSEQERPAQRKIKGKKVKVLQEPLPPADAFPADRTAETAKAATETYTDKPLPAPVLAAAEPRDFVQEDLPICPKCSTALEIKISHSNKNPDRHYFVCPRSRNHFFKWVEEIK